MSVRRIPSIEIDDRRRIYDYVERHGAVDSGRVAEALRMDPETFNHHLAILKRDDHLESRNGRLQVALDGGTAEEFSEAGVDYIVRPARQEDLSGVVGAIRETVEERLYIEAEIVAEQLDYEGALIRHNDSRTRMFFVSVVDGDGVALSSTETVVKYGEPATAGTKTVAFTNVDGTSVTQPDWHDAK